MDHCPAVGVYGIETTFYSSEKDSYMWSIQKMVGGEGVEPSTN